MTLRCANAHGQALSMAEQAWQHVKPTAFPPLSGPKGCV